MVQLTPTPGSPWSNNILGEVIKTLWMIGDEQSVKLISILVDPRETYTYGRNVMQLRTQSFKSSSSLSPVRFDNDIQWYRSSSFAPAYTGYNNTYVLPPFNETARLSWNGSTPLSATLISSTFLRCINFTIIAAPLIIDQDPPIPPGRRTDCRIVVNSVVAVPFGVLCFLYIGTLLD